MPVFPRVMDILQQSMAAASLRHQVIANNIANVNVPGFQGTEVSFEERLQASLEPSGRSNVQGLRADARHIPISTEGPGPVMPVIVQMEEHHMRQDGNTIDVEEQMAKLAANQLWYQALVRSMSDELGRLRTAIMEGRR